MIEEAIEGSFGPHVIIKHEGERTFSAYLKTRLVGRLILDYPNKKRPGTVSVFKVAVDFPQEGIGRRLYNAAKEFVEKQGLRLVPSDTLTDDGLAFWSKYDPDAVAHEGRIWGKNYIGKVIEWKGEQWEITNMIRSGGLVKKIDGSGITSICPLSIIFDQLGAVQIPQRDENFSSPINSRTVNEDHRMTLRALIAESEAEYSYTLYSPCDIHCPESLAMIRIGLAGRMARDIQPKGIIPYGGTKADRFPEQAMKPVYVSTLITGMPLHHKRAIQELALALNIPEELIQLDGEDADKTEEVKAVEPYSKDGEPAGLDLKNAEAHMLKSLKDLLGDILDSEQPEELRDVYEGFTITQIEAEALLGEDLRRGYYVVRDLGEAGRVGISGPHLEVPVNYPMNLDRVKQLQIESINSRNQPGSGILHEFDISLVGKKTLKEMNYTRTNLASTRVVDTDSGKEYPVLITVQPGMGDDDIRNAAVQEIAHRFSISPERLIAKDPGAARAA